MVNGTVIVSWEVAVVDRKKIDGLSEAKGSVGETVDVTLSVAWNPLRLWKLRVIVEFAPGEIVRLLAGLVRLKSVTVIVNWAIRVRLPSVADIMIV